MGCKIRKSCKVFIIFLLVFYFFYVFEIPCLFKMLTNIPCPSCGAAHALIDLCSGNVSMYTQRNVLALPLALILFFAFYTQIWVDDAEKRRYNFFACITIMIFLVFLHFVRFFT